MESVLLDVFGDGLGREPVHSQSNSRILQWHFPKKPIVPGVVLELLSRVANKQHSKLLEWWVKAVFNTTVCPWNILKIVSHGDRVVWLLDVDKEAFTMTSADGEIFPDFTPNRNTQKQSADSEETISNNLLQSWSFRFVSWAELGNNGLIFWFFELPWEHPLYDEEWWFWREILQESANQIISLAHSKNLNPRWVQEGKTLLLKESTTVPHLEWYIRQTRYDTMYLLWRMLDRNPSDKRSVGAIYTAYCANHTPLFSGKIKWTEISTGVLFR